jgi:hypothetical protein
MHSQLACATDKHTLCQTKQNTQFGSAARPYAAGDLALEMGMDQKNKTGDQQISNCTLTTASFGKHHQTDATGWGNENGHRCLFPHVMQSQFRKHWHKNQCECDVAVTIETLSKSIVCACAGQGFGTRAHGAKCVKMISMARVRTFGRGWPLRISQ